MDCRTIAGSLSHYGPRADGTAYAIIGPPNVPKENPDAVRYSHWKRQFQELVFHEFSHSLLNLAEGLVPETAERLYVSFGSMPSNSKFREIHGDSPSRLWFDELVIRAATALYEKEMGREAGALAFLTRQEEEYGLGWIRDVYGVLDEYLARRKSGKCSGFGEGLLALESTFADHHI